MSIKPKGPGSSTRAARPRSFNHNMNSPTEDFDVPEVPPEIDAEGEQVQAEPAAPQQATAAPAVAAKPESEPEQEDLPNDLKASLKILHDVDAMPTRNAWQEREKAKALAIVRAHVAKLQQGCPIISITADGYAKAHGGANLLRTRLEIKARTDLDVRALLEERDELAAQIEKITQ